MIRDNSNLREYQVSKLVQVMGCVQKGILLELTNPYSLMLLRRFCHILGLIPMKVRYMQHELSLV